VPTIYSWSGAITGNYYSRSWWNFRCGRI